MSGADDDKMGQIRNTIKNLQDELSNRASEIKKLKTELEEAKAGQKDTSTPKKAMRAIKEKMTEMRQKASEIKDQAEEKAQQELEEARKKIDELEQQIAQDTGDDDEPGGMVEGGTAWVRQEGGMDLNRRSAPTLNSTVHDGLAPGTQLTLVQGPVPADGYTWWYIRASDGREGWVAGEELTLQQP